MATLIRPNANRRAGGSSARYDSAGYNSSGQRQILGYSHDIQGGAEEARERARLKRERHYTNRLPQFISAPASPPSREVTVPSYDGKTKTIMPDLLEMPQAGTKAPSLLAMQPKRPERAIAHEMRHQEEPARKPTLPKAAPKPRTRSKALLDIINGAKRGASIRV